MKLHVDVAFGMSPEWVVTVTASKNAVTAWVWADDGDVQIEGKTARDTKVVARVLGTLGLAQLHAIFSEALEVRGGVPIYLAV